MTSVTSQHGSRYGAIRYNLPTTSYFRIADPFVAFGLFRNIYNLTDGGFPRISSLANDSYKAATQPRTRERAIETFSILPLRALRFLLYS